MIATFSFESVYKCFKTGRGNQEIAPKERNYFLILPHVAQDQLLCQVRDKIPSYYSTGQATPLCIDLFFFLMDILGKILFCFVFHEPPFHVPDSAPVPVLLQRNQQAHFFLSEYFAHIKCTYTERNT